MSDINDGLQFILDAINNIVEPKLDRLKYDKTYRAKVISNEGSGQYTIQINSNNYSITTTATLTVGQVIKVKAPLNNFSDIYIEEGTSGGGGTSDYKELINKPILDTTSSTALSTNNAETIINTIKLHKVSKTGNYNDLLNLPTIPTQTSQLTNNGSDGTSPYATQAYVNDKVSAVYKYKGSVATYSDLPTTGNIIGDVWNVTDTGKNYAWTGSGWDDLGGTVDLSNYYTKDQTFSQSQINALLDLKAPLDSPNLTGIPIAPTATSGTSTNQLATTAFVEGEIANNVTSETALPINEIITATGVNRGVQGSGTIISTTLNPNNDTNIPTGKAVAIYVKNNLPIATSTDLGAIKVGNNLQITDDGTLNAISGGTGTVSSVGISNLENGGLTISNSPITTSGTINIGHTNILSNSQTTQGLYPITIDKNGHIATFGNKYEPYPIGSIYLSVNSTNPSTFFGGTWTQIQNTFLLAAGTSYTAGATGGTTTHSHTNPNTGAWSGTSGGTGLTTNAWSGTSGAWSGTSGGTAITQSQLPGVAVVRTNTSNTQGMFNDITSSGWSNHALRDSGETNSQTHNHSIPSHQHSLPSHTHTVDSHTHSLPSHTHTVNSHTHSLPSHTHTVGNTGSSSNMPPYLVVYMWKRTA